MCFFRSAPGFLLLFALACTFANADEPKPAAENTIHVQLSIPVQPQKFPKQLKFFLLDVTDRSGNPQPMMVLKERGGVFLDRLPAQIAREAIEQSLKTADLLAPDAASADIVLKLYLFHFGLAQGSGLDFFGKVEFAVMVKNPKTGASQQIQASGTSIANGAFRKKNMQKNVQANIEGALEDAVRNLLRGTQLKEAISTVTKEGPATSPSVPSGNSGFFGRNLSDSVGQHAGSMGDL